MPAANRSFQGVLNQIVRCSDVAHECSGVASQRRNNRLDEMRHVSHRVVLSEARRRLPSYQSPAFELQAYGRETIFTSLYSPRPDFSPGDRNRRCWGKRNGASRTVALLSYMLPMENENALSLSHALNADGTFWEAAQSAPRS